MIIAVVTANAIGISGLRQDSSSLAGVLYQLSYEYSCIGSIHPLLLPNRNNLPKRSAWYP